MAPNSSVQSMQKNEFKETPNSYRLRMSPLQLILSILIPFLLFASSQGCGITIYWGQNGEGEGDLIDACNSGLYKHVSIAFLTNFGGGRTPVLNLTGHCDPQAGTCTRFGEQIKECQKQGIKVLLSLKGSSGSYYISSPEDAWAVARDIWIYYLGDTLFIHPWPLPLGDVALDGVDFDLPNPGFTSYWDDLARALRSYSLYEGRKIQLSAAIPCAFHEPRAEINSVINKLRLFDFVYVRFYNTRLCDYSGENSGLLRSWNRWSSYLPKTKVFLGLAAAPEAASIGYIPPAEVATEILPVIRTSANYGGVTLWNRYYDVQTGYSSVIYPAVCHNTATLNHEDMFIKQVLVVEQIL